ncbi:putative ribonuclease, partial [Gordonia hirsuta DSM 44140 = NBRC 16056]
MTDNGSPTDAQASDDSAETFPLRLRVHALARTLGITSREALAHLQDMGILARSASSSVSRDEAQAVADRLAAPDDAAPADQAHTVAPVTESLFSAVAVEEPAVPAAAAAETAPLFLPPTTPEPVVAEERNRTAAGSGPADGSTETAESAPEAATGTETTDTDEAEKPEQSEQSEQDEQDEKTDSADSADGTDGEATQRSRRRR